MRQKVAVYFTHCWLFRLFNHVKASLVSSDILLFLDFNILMIHVCNNFILFAFCRVSYNLRITTKTRVMLPTFVEEK